jgi:hypothetical protein
MATEIQPVQPGDLITSAFFNELIGYIEGLDGRVTALEEAETPAPGQGAVVITAISATSARELEDITIVGENFGFSIGAHRVEFDGTPAAAFRTGSSDTVLICQVPELPSDPPDTGTTVTLEVSNAISSASRAFKVLPKEVQQAGNIDTIFEGASPDPLTADEDNTFEFQFRSDAPLPATLEVNPAVTTPTGTPLPWSTAVLDADGDVVSDRRIPVPSLAEVTFFVRVSIPNGTNGTAFRLDVDSEGGGITTTSGPLDFTVGQNADPDTNIIISPSTPATIEATTGAFTIVAVEADFLAVGTYTITLTPLGGLTGWTTTLTSPSSSNPNIQIDSDDLAGDGIADRTITFRVRPNAGATEGQLRLTAQRTTPPSTRSRSFTFDMHIN